MGLEAAAIAAIASATVGAGASVYSAKQAKKGKGLLSPDVLKESSGESESAARKDLRRRMRQASGRSGTILGGDATFGQKRGTGQ